MTPTELETYCRQRHNIVGDTFWSSAEILEVIQDACNQLARRTNCIKRIYTTSTVAGTQQYSFPTNTLTIKRVTYDGIKLNPMSQRDDDRVTGYNQETTGQGTPANYYEFGKSIFLRPIPAEVKTLKIFSFNYPQDISTSSSLEVPEEYHLDLALYALHVFHAKEKNFPGAQFWLDKWEKRVLEIKSYERLRLRSDAFTSVADVESMSQTFVGNS